MLDRIIYFSIKNKLIIGVSTIILFAWGVWSATQLPIDAVPDITNNQVQIVTTSPSLAPPEIERFITSPIEMCIAGIPGIAEMRSISRFGLSVITVVFSDETDIYWARQQLSEKLQLAMDNIPAGIGVPRLMPVTTGLGEVYQYVLHPKNGYQGRYSAMELRTIQDWIVRRQLLSTKGVVEVSSFGGYVKQYEVTIDPDKLRAINVSIDEIFHALEQNNQNTGGAYIDKRPHVWFIHTEGLIEDINDINNIVVKTTSTGSPILIRDVAKVQIGNAIRYGALTRNNEGEAVGGIVMMLKGENSREVIKNIKERIDQIRKTLPEGLEIHPFLDRSTLVNTAINTVLKNLTEGALIVIFVLVLMLGNIRAGLIVASVIPLSMLFAISMMRLFGVSGNLMSLGAIDFGIVVDGAVIIVEATLHHLMSKSNIATLTQEQMDSEIYKSASKIRKSAAFGEIIILIVYIPILALTGIEGKMFKPMAQTVSFAIAGAFLLSITYVPMMSSLFLKKKKSSKTTLSDRIMLLLREGYITLREKTFKYKIVVLICFIFSFAGSIVLFFFMGGEFIPTLEEGDFAVEMRLMQGSSLSQTVESSLKAGDILLKKFPEVKEVIGKIGSAEVPTDPMPMEACDLMIILKKKTEWVSATTREELAEKMKKALEGIPGINFGFTQPIQMRFNELMTGAKQDVAIKVYGEDLDTLSSLAEMLGENIANIKGVKDVYVERQKGLAQIVVKYDREKIQKFGISIHTLNQTLNTAFAGRVAGLVYEKEKKFELVLRLEENKRSDIEHIRLLPIKTSSGQMIPLNQVAEVNLLNGYNQIQHDEGKRRIIVAFNVRGRNVESVVNEIQNKVEPKLQMPAGYYIRYGGQFQNLIKAKERLGIAVPAALLMIFFMLYITFKSLKQSILIFTAIPMSAIGGIVSLWLCGMPFSISAGVGFIALFGVAVLNGIVLINEFNRIKKQGYTNTYDIVRLGTDIRLRPVIMTAMVASFGFLPMALSESSGAEVQKPLAIVVIGGLISSTLLTLFVLPILYILSEKWDIVKVNRSIQMGGILLAVILFTFNISYAQMGAPFAVTIEQALQMVYTQNQTVKSAKYNLQHAKTLKGTSYDVGKTNFMLMYGQFNSYYNDNSITITQNFPFPSTFHREAQVYTEHIKSAEYNLAVTLNELYYKVKTAYYNIVYSKAKKQLFNKIDTLYTQFSEVSKTRLQVGEAAALEKITAESQLYEIRSNILTNEVDLQIYENQLSTLLNSQNKVTSIDSVLNKKNLILTQDSVQLMNNPTLLYFKQQVITARALQLLEKSKLLPELSVGYFNQSLYGTPNYRSPNVYATNSTRFHGITAGISLSLWFKPQLHRIKASQIYENIAQANYNAYQKKLQGEFQSAYQTFLKYQNTLQYYEQNVLPTSKTLQENALINYRSGNIGYLEFSQAVAKSVQTELAYLDLIHKYNQAILFLEYLTGLK